MMSCIACSALACATARTDVESPSIAFAIVEPAEVSAQPGVLRHKDEAFTVRERRSVRFATAAPSQDVLGYPAVSLIIDPRDVGDFGRWTLVNVDRTLAILVDEQIVMTATINSGPLHAAMLSPSEPWSEKQAESFAARVHAGGTACPRSADAVRGFELASPYEPLPHAQVEIALERGVCFGECPVYALRVRGDGSVSYRGDKYVRSAGERESTVTQETIRRLLARFAAVDFFSLPDRSAAKDSCPQSIVLTLTVNGRTKRVEHLYGGGDWGDDPDAVVCEALDALSDAVDYETGSRRWTGP